MQNDDNTLDVTEETQSNETSTDIEQSNSQEEMKRLQDELKKAQDEAAKFRRIAEKNSKPKEEVKETFSNPSVSEESVDIKILMSQGIDEESIEYMKKIAKVNGTSILAAQHDELYKTWKNAREEKIKSEKAQLGASRGSGSAKVEKTMQTPGLSDEDHKAMWLRNNGR